MCLLAFAINEHPDYPFVFVGNRDEFHDRETAGAHWWKDAPHVFGGRDLEAGGAWLGVGREGRFAVLTNFRDPDQHKPGAPSRGELAREFLAEQMDDREMGDWLLEEGRNYAGFNILYGKLGPEPDIAWYSNVGGLPAPQRVQPGIHGLSNHLLDTPWPKVERTTAALQRILAAGNVSHDQLQSILADRRPATDERLPETGIPLEWERLLSAPMIVSARYGTRASTSVLLDRDGNLSFRETSLDRDGKPVDVAATRFRLPMPSVTISE